MDVHQLFKVGGTEMGTVSGNFLVMGDKLVVQEFNGVEVAYSCHGYTIAEDREN